MERGHLITGTLSAQNALNACAYPPTRPRGRAPSSPAPAAFSFQPASSRLSHGDGAALTRARWTRKRAGEGLICATSLAQASSAVFVRIPGCSGRRDDFVTSVCGDVTLIAGAGAASRRRSGPAHDGQAGTQSRAKIIGGRALTRHAASFTRKPELGDGTRDGERQPGVGQARGCLGSISPGRAGSESDDSADARFVVAPRWSGIGQHLFAQFDAHEIGGETGSLPELKTGDARVTTGARGNVVRERALKGTALQVHACNVRHTVAKSATEVGLLPLLKAHTTRNVCDRAADTSRLIRRSPDLAPRHDEQHLAAAVADHDQDVDGGLSENQSFPLISVEPRCSAARRGFLKTRNPRPLFRARNVCKSASTRCAIAKRRCT